MTSDRIPRHPRTAVCAALTAAVVAAPVAGAGPASAASVASAAAATAPRPVCVSHQSGLAGKMSKDIAGALRGRSGTVAISLRDHTTHTRCTLRANQGFDSASVVKVTVLGTLLWDAQRHHRGLTKREKTLAKAMITKSDNASTSKLWKQLKPSGVKAFVRAAGMDATVPGKDGYWGLTRITANDQERLLDLITHPNTVLSDGSRACVLSLMGKVIPEQRWGTPAGAPGGTRIHVKNGWLERSTHGWRVHSIGAFTGGGHDYTLTVLTQGNRTMEAGVATIEAVARAVHRDLTPTAYAVTRYAPTDRPEEALPAVPKD
ncbi:serine hydrolase [Streptomyces sp. 110]|uniref:Serine hydrolase n=1 Tax=Streptomyces endocoffeicus TaxID=2898945 RepID=A0ABS1PW28_9ACTN|nr:serine hydrolase [Streptomyces endocoffeicus]MBL1116645.1 serine hydrolase [Streptomyces endocoffeicus]